MRLLPAVLVLLLLASAVPAGAQPPTFTEAYQLRGAVGDIPTTNATEPADAWNLEQRLAVQFTNGTEQQYGFAIPAGASLVNATCTCNPSQSRVTADAVVFTFPTTLPSGQYTMTVTTTQPAGEAFGFHLNIPIEAGAGDRVAILYVPTGSAYDAPAEPHTSLPSTSGQATILQFDEVPSPFWLSVHPDSGVATETDTGGWGYDAWTFLALGIAAGAVLWSVLVSKGLVQKRSRKQVAGTAAHVEAAANDPPAVLEGKKRALLAALKEIEVAKMNNEMPADVYDVVKADLKRQAVTVMRALESRAGAPEDPKGP